MIPAHDSSRTHFQPAETVDPDLIQTLTGMDANASMAVAHRARRAVREVAFQIRDDRKRRRRNRGMALLIAAGFLMLLTPALWSGVDAFFAGEHISDMPAMFTMLAFTLFSAVIAALLASWKNHQPTR